MRKRWMIILMGAWLVLAQLTACASTNTQPQSQKEPPLPYEVLPPEEEY